MIKFNKVASSALDGVHYDTLNKTLHIRFKNQTIYTYHDVPEVTYSRLLDSKSKGKFLTDHIHDLYKVKKQLTK